MLLPAQCLRLLEEAKRGRGRTGKNKKGHRGLGKADSGSASTLFMQIGRLRGRWVTWFPGCVSALTERTPVTHSLLRSWIFFAFWPSTICTNNPETRFIYFSLFVLRLSSWPSLTQMVMVEMIHFDIFHARRLQGMIYAKDFGGLKVSVQLLSISMVLFMFVSIVNLVFIYD